MVQASAKKNLHKVEDACLQATKKFTGGKFLVALSGGADSVSLLLGMHNAGIRIEAANCNFHLRGEESHRDSEFCKDLCHRLGIKLHYIDFDTKEYIDNHKGISLEMACRQLRHQWFDTLVQEHGFTRLATGHTASDNAETIFMNLLRGSGLRGLKGMDADNGRVIRPLLKLYRSDIVQFLKLNNQDYVTDSTNLESDYRRNYLRNEIFPLLREKWRGMDAGIARTIDVLGREYMILDHALSEILSLNPEKLGWDTISSFPDPQTLIFHFIAPYGGSAEIAAEISRSLPYPLKGKEWLLPKATAVAGNDALEIVLSQNIPAQHIQWERIELDSSNREQIKKRVIEDRTNVICWLGVEPTRFEFRRPQRGDRIHPLGIKGSKLCSDIISDGKLSAYDKKSLKILVDNESGEAVWIPGLKRSRLHLIDLENATHCYAAYVVKAKPE